MLGSRLKLARKKAGLSQRAVVDAIDGMVSAMAISKYETGEMTPSSDVLIALSKALQVTLPYLLDPQELTLEEVDFRKKSTTTARERAAVEAEVLEWVGSYLQIEQILGLESVKWNAPFAPRAIKQIENAEKVARDLRGNWELGEDPILNMTELLEEKGLKVLIRDLPIKVSGLTCLVQGSALPQPVPVIVVNRRFPLERRRLTLAHELAHRLIDGKYLNEKDVEKAANRFAGAFLVPASHLEREVGALRHALGYRELITLKRIYRISGAALLVRMRDIGIIDNGVLSTAFQTIARSWRTSEPDQIEEENERGQRECERRFERLCYRALAEQLVTLAKVSELLQRPVDIVEQELRGSNADHNQ